MGPLKVLIDFAENALRLVGVTETIKVVSKQLFDQLEHDQASLRRYDDTQRIEDPETGRRVLPPYQKPLSIRVYSKGPDLEVFEK